MKMNKQKINNGIKDLSKFYVIYLINNHLKGGLT